VSKSGHNKNQESGQVRSGWEVSVAPVGEGGRGAIAGAIAPPGQVVAKVVK
jgi:hypothetical protein